MTLYRKRSDIHVEARRFDGSNAMELVIFTDGRFRLTDTRDFPFIAEVYDELHDTWAGVKTGDWIMRGPDGEFYPCDGAMFAKTYEPVPEVES